MRNEYVKTIFCDIDGTLIKQVPFELLNENEAEVLPGVYDKFKEWNGLGYCIVLTTARPEHLRNVTVKQLFNFNINYTQLVMGIGREERILINNNSLDEPNEPRALSIAMSRNNGFENLNFESVGL